MAAVVAGKGGLARKIQKHGPTTAVFSPPHSDIRPDEIYNLGAQSHVQVSFQLPQYTAEASGVVSVERGGGTRVGLGPT